MTRLKKTVRAKAEPLNQQNEQFVRARIKALEIPPIKDGIIIGRAAPMGAEAMMRTLKLMSNERFVHLPVTGDDVVSDIIVREAVIRKMKEEKLLKFVLTRIRPVMSESELLMVEMDIEVVIEETL